mgnify:CR=1 FL=1
MLFAESAFGYDGEIDVIVISVAVEDVLEIDCFIRYIECYCDNGDEVMQLWGFILRGVSSGDYVVGIDVRGNESELSCHGEMCNWDVKGLVYFLERSAFLF